VKNIPDLPFYRLSNVAKPKSKQKIPDQKSEVFRWGNPWSLSHNILLAQNLTLALEK
jgi:hypothetical protein